MSMSYTVGNKYGMPKNLCKRTVLVQLIIENVVTCFLEHIVQCILFFKLILSISCWCG